MIQLSQRGASLYVRTEAYLAVLCLMSLSGCKTGDPNGTLRYVNLEAIMPLHPAWTLVRSLPAQQIRPIGAPELQLAFPPIAPLRTPTTHSQDSPRLLPVELKSRNFMQQRIAALRRGNSRTLDREEKALLRKLSEDMLLEEAKLRETLLAARKVRLIASASRARDKSLKLQLEALKLSTLAAAGLELSNEHFLELQDEIDVEKTKQRNAMRDIEPTIREKLIPMKHDRERQIFETLKLHRIELEQTLVRLEQTNSSRFAVAMRYDSGQAKFNLLHPAVGSLPEKRLRQTVKVDFGSIQPISAPPIGTQSNEKSTENLSGRVKADVLAAVRTIAEREHWTLTDRGAKGSKDATAEVRAAISKLWKE